MQLDVVDLLKFYRTPLGRLVAPVLAKKLGSLWPKLDQDRMLGFGFPTPYTSLWLDRCERCFSFMPASQGIFAWPREQDRLAALVQEDAWPLLDSSVDRILSIHALEMVENPLATLEEAWRVLSPGGKLLLVVPSRRGVWARLDNSPFGHGRPYSRGQLKRLLTDAQFTIERWDGALYMPPSNAKVLLKASPGWEKLGARFWPALPGVWIVEASKQILQGLPAGEKVKAKKALKPVLVPATGTARVEESD